MPVSREPKPSTSFRKLLYKALYCLFLGSEQEIQVSLKPVAPTCSSKPNYERQQPPEDATLNTGNAAQIVSFCWSGFFVDDLENMALGIAAFAVLIVSPGIDLVVDFHSLFGKRFSSRFNIVDGESEF